LAGCAAIDVVIMLKKRRKTIQDFTIENVGVRRDDPPRKFTDIHCKFVVTSPDVTLEELEKAAKLSLEKYCSVGASLNSHIHISAEVIRPET
jgi:putative redox protein